MITSMVMQVGESPCQGLIESILTQLPQLRTVVVRIGFQGMMPDIKLVSESLE